MKETEEQRERLLRKLAELTNKLVPDIFEVRGKTGHWIQIQKEYDFNKIYRPNTFLLTPKSYGNQLIMIVGVGKCGCRFCKKRDRLFMLSEKIYGVWFWYKGFFIEDLLKLGCQFVYDST